MDTLTLTYRPDAATRAVAVDMVRRALGADLPISTLHRAVVQTAQMLRHPADVAAHAAALATPSNGTMAPHQSAPDAFTAQCHTVKVGRNKKGPTRKVVARGAATVIGGRGWHLRPCLSETMVDRTALVTDLLNVRRIRCGAVALDVLRVTDRHYLNHDVPALLGTDLVAFEQVLPGDRTSRCSVAVQHAGLSGLVSTTAADRLAAHGAVYGPHTRPADDITDGSGDSYRAGVESKVADMLSRRRITFRPRKAERARVEYSWQSGDVLPASPISTALVPGHLRRTVSLVTGHDRTVNRADGRWTFGPTDRVFIGHTCQIRQAVVRQTVKRQAGAKRVADRTIGTVPAPSTVNGWRELVDAIGRGERIVTTLADGTRQAITRGKSGKYATNGTLGRWTGIRTPDAIALRLTSAG